MHADAPTTPAPAPEDPASGRFGPAADRPHWGALFYPAKRAHPSPATGLFGYLLHVPPGQQGAADFLGDEAQADGAPPARGDAVAADVERQATAHAHQTGVWWPLPGEPPRPAHWKHVARLAERRLDWVRGRKADQERDWERRKKEIADFATNPDPYGGLDGYVRARVGRAQCWAQVALGRTAIGNGADNLAKLDHLEAGLAAFLARAGAAVPPDPHRSAEDPAGEGGEHDGEGGGGEGGGDAYGPGTGAAPPAVVGDEDGRHDGGDEQ